MDKTTEQKELAKLIGKLLRDNFGRGPEFIYVSIADHYLVVYLKNFMSPMERILMDTGKEDIVIKTRDTLIQTVYPEIKAYINMVTGLEVEEFYYDWGLQNQSGCLFCKCSNSVSNLQSIELDYQGKQQLHDEIINLSKKVQKAPHEISSFLLDSRYLIITREGILVAIEKEFIRLGLLEQLRIAKSNVEKKYLHNNSHLESILKNPIIDCFIGFNFHKDKIHFVFVLNPATMRRK
ncbi:DUF2294 domain-containing protein [Ammoniphilus sp. 3BR4]|uniref:DUF2294 domain-containing protein n=1 Tax=Ammoniphilus sp. 3BR4 TaxID=3158265 RepID=UPI00346691B9